MRLPIRVAIGVAFIAILLAIGPTSADVPAISLKAPTVAPDAGHSVVGVVLSPDMRARLRRQGGSLTVQWSSSRGRGCLTRAAGDNRMDATFDLKGLDPGTVTMTASLTTGGQTFDSTPVTTGLFSVDVQPAEATVTQGQTFLESISTSPDTAALVQVTWQMASSVDGAILSSGMIPVSAFGPDGQGHLVATQTFLAPADFTGMAILTITAAASSLDAFGTPTTVTASSHVTLTIQPATTVPLALAFTTASGQGFPAGATADIGFTLQAPDPSTAQASFTVFDAQKSVVASGPATLTQTGAMSASGVASWAVPAGAGGQYTVTVFASQGAQSLTGSLAINVVPAPGPALAITQPGPITVTAGETATVGFTLTGVTSLTGATLQAVFTDRTTGAILSNATIDPATLVQQPGGFAGNFTFAFPVTSVPMDTTLGITYLENGAPVASGGIRVLVQPAATPIVVSIGSAPSTAAAGTSPPFTIVISGVTIQLMSSVSWSLKDDLGSTVATANVSLSQFILVGTHYEATLPMTLSPSITPGTYTLEAAMTTTAGTTFTASQPIAITEAVTLRFAPSDGTIVEGQPETIDAVLRPQIPVGAGAWYFLNGAGVVAPGLPLGDVLGGDFQAIVDSDGSPAWLLRIVLTIPPGTVSQATSVLFVVAVSDPAGRLLEQVSTPFTVIPTVQVPVLSAMNLSQALPGEQVQLEGAGFVSSDGQTSVLLDPSQGAPLPVTPLQLADGGRSLTFIVPPFAPVGDYAVRVRTASGTSNALPLHVPFVVELVLSPLKDVLPLLTTGSAQDASRTQRILGALFGGPSGTSSFLGLLEAGNVAAAGARLLDAVNLAVVLGASYQPAATLATSLKDMFLRAIQVLLARARARGVDPRVTDRAAALIQEAIRREAAGDLTGATMVLVQAGALLQTVAQPGHREGPPGFSLAIGGGPCNLYALLYGPNCVVLEPGNPDHPTPRLYFLLHTPIPGHVSFSVDRTFISDLGSPVAAIFKQFGDAVVVVGHRPGQIRLSGTFFPDDHRCLPPPSSAVDIDFIDFRISKCPADYLPNPEQGKNEVSFRVTIRPEGIAAKIRFDLAQVSTEPGTCSNAGSGGDPDLRFLAQGGFDAPSPSGQSIRTSTPVSEKTVLLTVKDYGAFGTIVAHADLCGADVTAHTHPDAADPYQAVERFAMIPRDDNPRNHIADAGWEAVISDAGASDHVPDDRPLAADDEDADDRPIGNGLAGDILGRFEEYRGFIVGGRHIRTSPRRKDVFVHDQTGIAPGFFTTQALSAPVHYVSDGETRDNRVINFNSRTGRVPGAPPQRALFVHPGNLTRTPFWALTDAPQGPAYPAIVNEITVDLAHIRGPGATLRGRLGLNPHPFLVVRLTHAPAFGYSLDGGKIKLDDEILEYESSGPGANGLWFFQGVTRGADGTQVAVHEDGTPVPNFVDTVFFERMLFAHECGHGVGMLHVDDTGQTLTIMKAFFNSGEYVGHWLDNTFSGTSSGQFRAH